MFDASSGRQEGYDELSEATGRDGFFSLPADLQLEVVQSWLTDNSCDQLILLLSALDTACGSRLVRRSFLCLAQGSIANPSVRWESEWVFKYACKSPGFVQWVHSRGLSIRRFYHPRGQVFNGIVLPSVRWVEAFTTIDVESLRSILVACPNATAIAWADFGRRNNEELWNVFADFDCSQLRELSIGFDSDFHLSAGMLSVGHCITSLGISSCSPLYDDCLLRLPSCLTNLLALKVTYGHFPVTTIAQCVAGCHKLIDLTLRECYGSNEDILSILEAGRGRLKRFEFNHCEYTWDACFPLFTDIMEQHGYLDALIEGKCSFVREGEGRKLNILFDRSGHELLERALNLPVCSSLVSLEISFRDICEEVTTLMAIVGRCSGHSLKELTVNGFKLSRSIDDMISFTPSFCPALETLKLLHGTASHTLVQQIALSFKCLRSLAITGSLHRRDHSITDEGIIGVLQSCTKLAELTLSNAPLVTSQTLQAIVDRRLNLRKLSFDNTGFNWMDVEVFQCLAKERQLFPILVFEDMMTFN